MAQRNDTILADMISEPYGGSAYRHFNLSMHDFRVPSIHTTCWIAPRNVRALSVHFVSSIRVLGDTSGINPAGATLRRWYGTDYTEGDDSSDPVVPESGDYGELVSPFNPSNDSTFATLNEVVEGVLHTGESNDYPNVVVRQYEFVEFAVSPRSGPTVFSDGLPNVTSMVHYAFED